MSVAVPGEGTDRDGQESQPAAGKLVGEGACDRWLQRGLEALLPGREGLNLSKGCTGRKSNRWRGWVALASEHTNSRAVEIQSNPHWESTGVKPEALVR